MMLADAPRYDFDDAGSRNSPRENMSDEDWLNSWGT